MTTTEMPASSQPVIATAEGQIYGDNRHKDGDEYNRKYEVVFADDNRVLLHNLSDEEDYRYEHRSHFDANRKNRFELLERGGMEELEQLDGLPRAEIFLKVANDLKQSYLKNPSGDDIKKAEAIDDMKNALKDLEQEGSKEDENPAEAKNVEADNEEREDSTGSEATKTDKQTENEKTKNGDNNGEKNSGNDRSPTPELTDIDGVGKSKAEGLKQAGFDTREKIDAASQEELSTADGIGMALAGRIKSSNGCKKLSNLATPWWRGCSRIYSRQYQELPKRIAKKSQKQEQRQNQKQKKKTPTRVRTSPSTKKKAGKKPTKKMRQKTRTKEANKRKKKLKLERS